MKRRFAEEIKESQDGNVALDILSILNLKHKSVKMEEKGRRTGKTDAA